VNDPESAGVVRTRFDGAEKEGPVTACAEITSPARDGLRSGTLAVAEPLAPISPTRPGMEKVRSSSAPEIANSTPGRISVGVSSRARTIP
jgi:hypothetical protein